MIKPGYETDLAVANVCGIEATILHLHEPVCFRKTATNETLDPVWFKAFGRIDSLPFKPSGNLVDAFLAADKFGLFERWCLALEKWHVGWTMVDHTDLSKKASERMVQASSTPALAICAAILKLAESK